MNERLEEKITCSYPRVEDYVGQSVFALVCNIQMGQMDMSISKLFIELPNYVCNEVL